MKSPETLLCLNWFASARELSERHDYFGNNFSHITLKKSVCDLPYVVWCLVYNLLKFDIILSAKEAITWKRKRN